MAEEVGKQNSMCFRGLVKTIIGGRGWRHLATRRSVGLLRGFTSLGLVSSLCPQLGISTWALSRVVHPLGTPRIVPTQYWSALAGHSPQFSLLLIFITIIIINDTSIWFGIDPCGSCIFCP